MDSSFRQGVENNMAKANFRRDPAKLSCTALVQDAKTNDEEASRHETP
jgi:hypothetical protein